MRKGIVLLALATMISGASLASEPPASADTTFNRFRVGGYGEIVAQFKDYGINRFNGTDYGNTRINRKEIAIPRFVLAMDFKPDRINAAKQIAIEFVAQRPADRMGVVVFAGASYTQCPLTTDRQTLINMMKDKVIIISQVSKSFFECILVTIVLNNNLNQLYIFVIFP